MTKLKISEKIKGEENRKVKNIVIGILIIFVAWILINIVLKVSYLGKIITGIALLLIIIYLIIEWYRAYYK